MNFLKFLTPVLILVILISGIFCYQGIQKMDTHCSADNVSVWCSDVLTHGTIISDAVMITFISALLLLSLIVYIKPILKLFSRIKFFVLPPPKTKNKVPILSPIQIAFLKGIIHPKIP